MLLREAAKDQKWNLNFGGIALMWRGGCIIRSRFLGKIKEAFDKNPQLSNLLLDKFFTKALTSYQAGWRRAIIHAVKGGVPTPAFTHGAGVLRWLPHRTPAGQPAPGAARFLRRAHLRAGGPAAGPVLPHQLDGTRRQSGVGTIHRLMDFRLTIVDELLTHGVGGVISLFTNGLGQGLHNVIRFGAIVFTKNK